MIDHYYHRGPYTVGRPSYSGLLLFKMVSLQTWYGLSDYEVEDQVSDRIPFSRFPSAMTTAKAYDKLLNLINFQLEKYEILVRTGVIVDASITDTPRKPRGKTEYNYAKS